MTTISYNGPGVIVPLALGVQSAAVGGPPPLGAAPNPWNVDLTPGYKIFAFGGQADGGSEIDFNFGDGVKVIHPSPPNFTIAGDPGIQAAAQGRVIIQVLSVA